MIPGDRLRTWARSVCSDLTMAHLIDPVIADMQQEAAEVSHARFARQAWILGIGYVAFWKIMAVHVPVAAVRQAWAPRETGEMGPLRALSLAGLSFLVITMLLVAPAVQSLPGRDNREQVWLLVLMLPQAWPLSVPVGLFIGVLCALRRRIVTGRFRRAVWALAFSTSLAMLVTINSLIPASSRAFREAVTLATAQRAVFEGPSNLSLMDGRRYALSLKESRPRESGRLLLSFHERVALSTAPLVLTLLAFGLAAARARVAAILGVSACTVFILWTSEASNMDRAMLTREWVAIALAWFPNVLLAATGTAVAAFSGGVSSEPRDA